MNSDSENEPPYVLMSKAGHPPTSSELSDPTSIATQLSQARGQGKLAKVGENNTIQPLRPEDDIGDNERLIMTFDNGQIKTESGFVMRFIDRVLVSSPLSAMDIAKIPAFRDYPVPQSALASLPAMVVNKAEDQGYVQFRGVYSQEKQTFDDVTLGWDLEITDPLHKMMRIYETTGSEIKSLDYMLFVHGGARWESEKAIAEYRDVEPETVRQNIIDVAEQLDESDEF